MSEKETSEPEMKLNPILRNKLLDDLEMYQGRDDFAKRNEEAGVRLYEKNRRARLASEAKARGEKLV